MSKMKVFEEYFLLDRKIQIVTYVGTPLKFHVRFSKGEADWKWLPGNYTSLTEVYRGILRSLQSDTFSFNHAPLS